MTHYSVSIYFLVDIVVYGQIMIRSRSPEYSLEALLEATPDEAVERSEEDNAWLDILSVGKEFDQMAQSVPDGGK